VISGIVLLTLQDDVTVLSRPEGAVGIIWVYIGMCIKE
jgi:hypothetical protein